MDPAMMASLAALPPHLKMQIMAAAAAQKHQDEATQQVNTDAVSDASSATTAANEMDADVAAILDSPLPPPPFTLPKSIDLAARCQTQGRILQPEMLHALERYGFIIVDEFARPDPSTDLHQESLLPSALAEARQLHAAGEMVHAGMKSAGTVDSNAAPATTTSASSSSTVTSDASSSSWKSATLRGDHHRWLHARDAEEARSLPALHRLMHEVDQVRVGLNAILRDDEMKADPSSGAPSPSAAPSSSSESSSTGWHASTSIECQVACYLGSGSRYVAHRDSIVGGKHSRRITAIVYLSEWKDRNQGGCLRIYFNKPNQGDPEYHDPFVLPYFGTGSTGPQSAPSDSIFFPSVVVAGSPSYVDIAPVSGRLVVFASSRMVHEVRPAHDLERWAMTVWVH